MQYEILSNNMKLLKEKEKIVLESIISFYEREGKMPTVKEIQKEVEKRGLKIKSIRSIFLYLNRLEEYGYIKRERKPRGIILNTISKNFVDVPILGAANAGEPVLYAEENFQGLLKVSRKIVGNRKVFAIQVEGDSMNLCEVNGKKIENGDYVIIDPNAKSFMDGNKVLVIIDGLATIKIYKKLSSQRIGLFPASTNESYKPIYLTPEDEFIIVGKVIEVLKGNKFRRNSEYIYSE